MNTIEPRPLNEKLSDLSALPVQDPAIVVKEIAEVDAFFAQVKEVDTTGVEPLYTPLQMFYQRIAFGCPLRDDVVTEHPDRELMQKSAPSVTDGLYLVPKVIQE